MNATTTTDGHATPYRPELALLKAFLMAENYTSLATWTILAHVSREGTIEGCPELEAEDREAAEGWLETGYPAVPLTSHAWDEESWSDTGPTYWPTGEDLLLCIWEHVHQGTMSDGPEGEPPYEPTRADLEEFGARLEAMDGDSMAFPREMTTLEKREAAREITRWWTDHEESWSV